MSSRRQEKVCKVIQVTVSEAIRDDLADPRVKGMVSVTRVEVTPDLRLAKVYLSIFGQDAAGEELCLKGIRHAHGFLQSRVAEQLRIRSCPVLRFEVDRSFKEGLHVWEILEREAQIRAAKQEDGAVDDLDDENNEDDEEPMAE